MIQYTERGVNPELAALEDAAQEALAAMYDNDTPETRKAVDDAVKACMIATNAAYAETGQRYWLYLTVDSEVIG